MQTSIWRERIRTIKALYICLIPLMAMSGITWAADEARERVWHDASGAHETAATFVRLDGNTVVLQKPDNTSSTSTKDELQLIRVPLKSLSTQDQEYVLTAVAPTLVSAASLKLEFNGTEQSVVLPLPSPKGELEYAFFPVRLRELNTTIDFADLSSDPDLAEKGLVEETTGKRAGSFPLPIVIAGQKTVVKVAAQFRTANGSLSLVLKPTIRIGDETLPFSKVAVGKKGLALAKTIAVDEQKRRAAEADLAKLPGELQRLNNAMLPLDDPRAVGHNTEVLRQVSRIENALRRAQRTSRAISKSMPINQQKFGSFKTVYDHINAVSGRIELEFELRMRLGDLSHVVLVASEHGERVLQNLASGDRSPDDEADKVFATPAVAPNILADDAVTGPSDSSTNPLLDEPESSSTGIVTGTQVDASSSDTQTTAAEKNEFTWKSELATVQSFKSGQLAIELASAPNQIFVIGKLPPTTRTRPTVKQSILISGTFTSLGDSPNGQLITAVGDVDILLAPNEAITGIGSNSSIPASAGATSPTKETDRIATISRNAAVKRPATASRIENTGTSMQTLAIGFGAAVVLGIVLLWVVSSSIR